MYASSRFNLLVVALIAFASFVTARTVITTQTCNTRFCNSYFPKSKICTVTAKKAIHKSARYTVFTRTVKPTITRTVKSTKTVSSQAQTKTIWKTSTQSTKATVWTGTSTHTRTVTTVLTSIYTTVTIPTLTVTISSTRTIPAPSGFVGVAEDPANTAAREPPRRPGDRRDAKPDSNAGRLSPRNAKVNPLPKLYPTAVTCTKVFLTKTGKVELCKTMAAATVTKTKFVSTKTIRPVKTVTKTSIKTIFTGTISTHKVAFASYTSVRTSYIFTDTTTILKTVTTQLPVENFYESCGPRNQSPRLELQQGWAAYRVDPYPGEIVHKINSNGTAHDCCVACHTYNQGGVCIGTVWRSTIFEGDPPCWPDPPDSCTPWEPEFRSVCQLVIAASNAPSLCRTHTYDFYTTGTEPRAVVSNGLGCKRYKFGKYFVSWLN